MRTDVLAFGDPGAIPRAAVARGGAKRLHLRQAFAAGAIGALFLTACGRDSAGGAQRKPALDAPASQGPIQVPPMILVR
jgi:hypothetical protein